VWRRTVKQILRKALGGRIFLQTHFEVRRTSGCHSVGCATAQCAQQWRRGPAVRAGNFAIATNRCQSAFSRRLQQLGRLIEAAAATTHQYQASKGDRQGFDTSSFALTGDINHQSCTATRAFHQRAL
jgi:hypothetical protein